MATAKITKKDMAQDEFIEGVFDFGEWLEVHWRRVAIFLIAAIAVVLLGVFWNSMREQAAEEANGLLASGIAAYAPAAPAGGQAAPPRYSEALTLFDQAAAKAGSGGVGDIARFFKARTLIALARPAEAVPMLEGLAASRNEGLANTAKVSLAEAVEATGNAERAATLLQEVAAPAKGAAYPTDAALLLLGGVRERQGKKDEAKKVYDDLLARFPQSPFANDARQRNTELTAKPR
jgi:predicted negative regulator of RcsB-dependent stress response